MRTRFFLAPSLVALAAPLALLGLGCNPAVASGYGPPTYAPGGPPGGTPAAPGDPAAAAPDPAESPEELAPIVQASHGEQQAVFSNVGPRLPARVGFNPGQGYVAADVRAPTTGAVIEGPVLGHDPQVAVGERFVIVYGSHKYEVRDKATGAPLAPGAGDIVAPSGDFNTIFAPVWHPRDQRGAPNAQNINHRLRFAVNDPLACDPESPTRSTACVQEFYDTRIMWDGLRKRFWIESAARNHLWHCKPGEECDDDDAPGRGRGQTKKSNTQARRYIAIAVSKTEDPRQGFHHFILVDEYSDWPKLAVNEHYLLLGHRSSPNIYVYDADRLAAGNPDHGPVRVAKLDARSFLGAKYLAPVTHHGPTNGVTYLLGSNGNDTAVPFALVNPDPTRAARPIVVAGPTIALGHKLGTLEGNAIYRGGFLYWANDEWAPGHVKEYRQIRVTRMPLSLQQNRLWAAADPRYGFLDAVLGGHEPDDAPGDVLDYEKPALDVNAAGAMVVVYSRKGFRTQAEIAPEVRYSILYPNEPRARPGVLVRRGTTSAVPDINDNAKAGIDLAFAQVDPSDDRTVWITHAYADGRARWYRQVVAATRP